MSQKHISTQSWHADPQRLLRWRLQRLHIGASCTIPAAYGGGLVLRTEARTYRIFRFGAVFVKQIAGHEDDASGPTWQIVYDYLLAAPSHYDEVG